MRSLHKKHHPGLSASRKNALAAHESVNRLQRYRIDKQYLPAWTGQSQFFDKANCYSTSVISIQLILKSRQLRKARSHP
ncbi:hypothetical protein CY34DRAFT_806529 [Suillus luteus UH-Slu-Lm8-n1]|uniref:Uncharacterized protein n=1 Tax=Suillus luteus UH-Slu-Lm8-n1 TaxID=930992 RepID=A0A0D0B3J9_9AGAM|nr:hypothetical protein CY34DRAFT_806529 [Suillus luteus UH-Slu-Lm8-n1]